MKKTYLTIALIAAVIALPSCGEEKKEEDNKDKTENAQESDEQEAEEAPEKMEMPPMQTRLTLSDAELPLEIYVPEGVAMEQGEWDTYVTDGGRFRMTVMEDHITAEEFMNNWKANDVNKLKNVLIEDENGFVVESEVAGQSEFHFYHTVTSADGVVYGFENAKDGSKYTEHEAMIMYTSARTAGLLGE